MVASLVFMATKVKEIHFETWFWRRFRLEPFCARTANYAAGITEIAIGISGPKSSTLLNKKNTLACLKEEANLFNVSFSHRVAISCFARIQGVTVIHKLLLQRQRQLLAYIGFYSEPTTPTEETVRRTLLIGENPKGNNSNNMVCGNICMPLPQRCITYTHKYIFHSDTFIADVARGNNSGAAKILALTKGR